MVVGIVLKPSENGTAENKSEGISSVGMYFLSASSASLTLLSLTFVSRLVACTFSLIFDYYALFVATF